MNSFDFTLSLLRSSLWGDEAPSVAPSEGWWEEIYEIATDQGVQTLIYDAFRPGLVPPKPLLARWVVDVERAEAIYERIGKVAGELSEIWSGMGLEFAILKGSSVAKFYPHPSHRLSGDIDFFFPDAEAWNLAEKKARRMADVKYDSDGDIHYVWKGVVIEHHRCWNHLSSKAASKMKADVINGELSEENTLLMLSSHILRHALVGGVGLRQLADLAVATRALDGKYDKEALASRMTSLGLEKWAGLISAVMYSSFGLSPEKLPVTPDPKYLSAFLNLICRDGDLGKENEWLLAGFFRRIPLFLKVCPGECFARWASLFVGRLKRISKKSRK